MIVTEKKIIYKAFGFSITSEIPILELPKMDTTENVVDIMIVKEDISKQWLEQSESDKAFVIKKKQIMFEVPDVAYFSISDGKRISICPLKEEAEDEIRLYLLGTCMGAILMQRGILPLHGSAVVINGKAYAFIGSSGAGKSTTASAFANMGYKLLTDDVIAISISNDQNIPFVIPSYPSQKLWEDSLEQLGMEVLNYRSIYGREKKYSIPIINHFCMKPMPLAGVFELVKGKGTKPIIHRIDSLQQFYTLYSNTYQNCFLPNLGIMDWHFETSAKIIKKVRIYQIERPAIGTSPCQLVMQTLKMISQGE